MLRSLLAKSYNYFSQVSENELQPEVSANKLSILFLMYNLLCPNINAITDIGENGTIEFTSNAHNDIIYLNNLKSHNRFIDKYSAEILECIKLLKSSNDYHELGDYYLSFFFICNLLPFENSDEESKSVIEHSNITGLEMTLAFYLLDNKYILELYNAIENLFPDE